MTPHDDLFLQEWDLEDEVCSPDEWLALSEDERARADRLKAPKARVRFIRARLTIRRALARHLGSFDGPIPTTAAGRPDLRSVCGWDVSWSHSHDRLALVGVRTGRVGVDVEVTRAIRRDVLRMVGSEDERRLISALTEQAQAEALLRLWTAKEAILKAYGLGFQADPRSISLPETVVMGHVDEVGLAAFSRPYQLTCSQTEQRTLAVAWTPELSLGEKPA